MEDEGFEPRFLIRDRDKKFPPEFDPFWKDEAISVIKTPVRAPKANAFAESYIGTFKREILNHYVYFTLEQLDYVNREWLIHYHEQRPHRGVGRDNTVLDEDFVPENGERFAAAQDSAGFCASTIGRPLSFDKTLIAMPSAASVLENHA